MIMLRAVFCCWWLVIDEAFLFFLFFWNRSRFSCGWVFGEGLAGADEVNPWLRLGICNL